MTDWLAEKERKAAAQVTELLALPNMPADRVCGAGECFEPWDLFPCLYGSYSSEFDEMAIEVLLDLKEGTRTRTDLASEMFREMLCTSDLCNYGTSPRTCFPTQAFKSVLPALIERWIEYAEIQWGDHD
jgi:hypothetical protein